VDDLEAVEILLVEDSDADAEMIMRAAQGQGESTFYGTSRPTGKPE